jgi:hypothetical protein
MIRCSVAVRQFHHSTGFPPIQARYILPFAAESAPESQAVSDGFFSSVQLRSIFIR